MIKYRRVPWPENITGLRADYYVERDGRRVAYIWVTRAGRSAGRFTHWRAFRMDGTQIAFASTLRDLKVSIEKALVAS